MIMENLNNKFSELLNKAVKQPGLILKAYSAFHGYSLGNQIAAMVQCQIRGITPGPINTFRSWVELGRHVKKGEKALWLCMPLVRKVKGDGDEDGQHIVGFLWKPRWFVISQTIGEEYQMPTISDWNKSFALANLNISEVEFQHTDGNALGYARKREIAISPLSPLPHKTCFHEMAHVELGHTSESDFQDSEHTPRSLREVEAEAVAMLLCESLKLPGVEYARGYCQAWLKSDVIPEKSAQRVFRVTDKILRAGREL
jgi:antirestriction protein ArdC